MADGESWKSRTKQEPALLPLDIRGNVLRQKEELRRPREEEGRQLEAAYSRVFFNYFKRVRIDGSDKHAKSVAFILDEIIGASRDLQYTNKISHCLVVFGNHSSDFADVYAWSRELHNLSAAKKASIQELVLEQLRSPGSLIHTSMLHARVVLAVHRDGQLLAYIQDREVFRKITGEFQQQDRYLSKISDLAKKAISAERGPVTGSFLMIPAGVPTQLSGTASIRATLLCFLGEDPEFNDGMARLNSNIELEYISLALLSINELGSAFEAKRHLEKTRILEGTRSLTHLFVHSFGQYARRITHAKMQVDDLEMTGASVASEFVAQRSIITGELSSVAADLQAIKDVVLSPLSDLDWNRTGNVGDALERARESVDSQLKTDCIDLAIENNFSGSVIVGIDTLILARLIENLLENAIRALHACEAKLILVRVQEKLDQNQVIVEIEDNGCGLPADFANWAYKARGKSQWTTGPSTGVGLFACRALLQMFGGDVEVRKSATPGMSTCASVRLAVN